MTYSIKKLKEVNPQLMEELRVYTYKVVGCCQLVHKELSAFLNEYIYQDALKIIFDEHQIPNNKEYYFGIMFHNQLIRHKHYVDFRCFDDVFVECKAVEHLCSEHRQQLWNYMRLNKTRIGILYNFAPVMDECERYYYDEKNNIIYAF